MPKRKHALCSASKAKQWLACPPSVKLEEQFPDSQSEYAKEGTAAHELAELAARYFIGEIKETEYEAARDELAKGEFYSMEMQECANDYARLVLETLDRAKDTCEDAFAELEVRIDFSEWVEDGFGTADCVVIADSCMEVIDFKYGKGVRVEAEQNPQMMLYALGAYAAYEDLYEIDQVRMTICQPRITRGVSSWTVDVDELLTWAENEVKPKAALAYVGKGEFGPSEDTCRFCKAKAQCRARAEAALKLFDSAPDPLLISIDEAAEILAKASDITNWVKDLEEYVTAELFKGAPVPGWKLVEGKSNRKFKSEDEVVKAMTKAGYDESLLYERKLISLTQMEKDFGKKAVADILGDLLIKPQGKPTLAPESDKRPAIVPSEEILKDFDR